MSSTEHDETAPTPGPWDVDVLGILERNPPADALVDVIDIDWLRGLMQSAWQFGYTSGMADSVKANLAVWAAQHMITVEGPLTYPGGKDGMFLARCSCNEYASAIGTEDEVRRDGAAHVRDKR